MLLSDYISQVQFLTHDQTNADFTQAELIAAINNARRAVSLDFHCVRNLYLVPTPGSIQSGRYSPVTLNQNQELYPLTLGFAQVVGANVALGGSGYTAATTVTFQASPGGQTALGSAVISGGVIQSINVTTWGTGYVLGSQPSVTINDPGGGSGAAATATVFNSPFNVVSISIIWGNQRYMLRFRGFTLFNAYMRSQLFFTQRPIIWTIHEQTGVVLIAPPPDQAYLSEWDVIVQAFPLVAPSDEDTQIKDPWSDAVQYYAAQLCLTKLQNFEQADYMLKLYAARVPRIIIGAGGTRIPNPYHKTFQRRILRG